MCTIIGTSTATVACGATPSRMPVASMGLRRSMWSLEIHIPAAHDSSTIIDASHLRCGERKKPMSLASIAEGAVWACNRASRASGTHGEFIARHYPIATPFQQHDKELQQVLQEVKGTAQDALQFQNWKTCMIKSHCKKGGSQTSITGR